jgi:hypothetical protein
MPTNLVDNTVGYFIAKYQNMKSRRELAQNPNRPIEYLMHGEVQNQGSQWRLARDSRKRGFVPYHLAGRHSLQRKLSTEQKVDNAYEQIQQLHNSVGIKNAYSRNDVFSGHSTGGNRAIDMAKDKRTIQYGIKTYQARAPNPVSTEPRTIWQKLLMTFLPGDSAKTPQGRARAVELAGKGTPLVPVHVVAGEYDRLVPPEDTVYKKAASHTIIRGPDSTHFGTSGGNRSINAQMLNHLYAAMNTSGHEYTPGASYKPLRAA